MDKKSKLISGLKDGGFIQKPSVYFTDEEKIKVIEEYLSSGLTKRDIWERYTGQEEEHGQLLRWMRRFGYDNSHPIRRPKYSPIEFQMKKKNTPHQSTDDSFENLQLKKRIEELEHQLKDAEMKAIAYSTMVDIAEKEFNISIRKKCNTKPSKR